MKLEDKYANKEDILLKDKSVRSKKTIAQMEKAPAQVYGQKKHKSVPEEPTAVEKVSKEVEKKSETVKPAETGLKTLLKKWVKKAFLLSGKWSRIKTDEPQQNLLAG